jgi:diguanylate cyclase (GGDEF)-like protein
VRNPDLVTAERGNSEQPHQQDLHNPPPAGLLPRLLLLDLLSTAVGQHRRDTAPLSVLFLDLEDFATLILTHGTAVGDDVLTIVEARVTAVIGPGNVVARLGGATFAVLCLNNAANRAEQLAVHVADVLTRPIILGGQHHILLTTSVAATTTRSIAGPASPGLVDSPDHHRIDPVVVRPQTGQGFPERAIPVGEKSCRVRRP